MTSTATTLTREIADFAAAVRVALADLPPEELDDLTDGLEADLGERAAEGGTHGELGDPVAYAEELRAAAGYPPRAAHSHLGATLPNLRTLPQEVLRRATAFADAHPFVRSIGAFLLTLRPVWWVFRGWTAWLLFWSFFGGYIGIPNSVASGLALGAIVVVSVQWGRGRWLPAKWMRSALLLVNVALVVAAPFIVVWAINSVNEAAYSTYYTDSQVAPYSNGLTEGNGQQVSNIFAYDAQGNPIGQIQLFDQDGNPLSVATDSAAQWLDAPDGSMLVPNADVPGRPGWNVFPLAHVNSWSDYEDDGQLDATELSPTTFPFAQVKPLSGSEPATTSAPTTTSTSTPTPAPAP